MLCILQDAGYSRLSGHWWIFLPKSMRGWWKINISGEGLRAHAALAENIKEKSPYFRTSSHLEYGGEGGIDSLRSPCGQPVRCALSLSNWLSPVVEPRSGILIPPCPGNIKEKSPYFRTSSYLEYGGEGGIRTPDTLPYTHFPGVLLQPLGHLTILFCCLTAWGATGRYYRELR